MLSEVIMQVLESSVTTMYSDGSKKTRKIEGELITDGFVKSQN